MARQTSVIEVNKFVAGLITEATPLNFLTMLPLMRIILFSTQMAPDSVVLGWTLKMGL